MYTKISYEAIQKLQLNLQFTHTVLPRSPYVTVHLTCYVQMSDEPYLYKLKFEGVHVVWHNWTGPKCEPLGGQ